MLIPGIPRRVYNIYRRVQKSQAENYSRPLNHKLHWEPPVDKALARAETPHDIISRLLEKRRIRNSILGS